jgi:hypothetical protein
VADESEDCGSLATLSAMDFRDPFVFAGFLKRQMESGNEDFFQLTIESFSLKVNGMRGLGVEFDFLFYAFQFSLIFFRVWIGFQFSFRCVTQFLSL